MDDITVTQWLEQEDRRVSQTIRPHGCSLEYVLPCQRPSTVSVPALQLIWSVHGAFPWDDGYPYAPENQPRPGTFSAVVADAGDTGPCGCC